MRLYLLLVTLVCTFFLTNCAIPPEPKPEPKPVPINIFAGNGVAGIKVGRSNKTEVIEQFGPDYELVHNAPFTSTLVYKDLGLSFFMGYNNQYEIITNIEITEPFIGKTDRGIILGRSSMQDVVDAYGESRWVTIKEHNTWWKMYPGIEFHVEVEADIPRFPLNKPLHQKKTIVKIDIVRF